MQLLECNWPEFRKLYPGFVLTCSEVKELLKDGYVAIPVYGPKMGQPAKVFTVRLEVAESEIGVVDFSNAVRGKFTNAGKRRKVVPRAKG